MAAVLHLSERLGEQCELESSLTCYLGQALSLTAGTLATSPGSLDCCLATLQASLVPLLTAQLLDSDQKFHSGTPWQPEFIAVPLLVRPSHSMCQNFSCWTSQAHNLDWFLQCAHFHQTQT